MSVKSAKYQEILQQKYFKLVKDLFTKDVLKGGGGVGLKCQSISRGHMQIAKNTFCEQPQSEVALESFDHLIRIY